MLSRYNKAQRLQVKVSRCQETSHANFRYLRTPERIERFRQMRIALNQKNRKIRRLELSLEKAIEADSMLVDKSASEDLLAIMCANTNAIESTDNNRFKTIFWEQQLKAKSCKSSRGMRWHPALIRWCLYLHHRSSGAYSTLRNSELLALPSERTLRDYRHFAPSTVGFSKDTDMQLLDLLKQQSQQNISKYVSIMIDEMYIKEGLVFDKKTGSLIGFADLGDINNLFSEYEDSAANSKPKPLAKVMLTFMLRGLFTNMKFVYAQFPAVSTKGTDIFVLLWKAIDRLTRLGLTVVTVTCDGASNNRKMFEMHGLTNGLPYKTTNVFDADKREVFFICDPPHMIKTIRNCFARGNLWVCMLYLSIHVNVLNYDFHHLCSAMVRP